jgi:hypothetical protein
MHRINSNVKLVVDMPDEGRRDLADATLYGRVGVFAEVEGTYRDR